MDKTLTTYIQDETENQQPKHHHFAECLIYENTTNDIRVFPSKTLPVHFCVRGISKIEIEIF